MFELSMSELMLYKKMCILEIIKKHAKSSTVLTLVVTVSFIENFC